MEGKFMNGRYRIVKKLGGRQDAEVYLAEYTALGTYRVLKVLNKSCPYYGQLKAEADILKVLNHPCIPALFDLEEDKENLIIAEQYMEGESLKAYCGRGGKLSNEIIVGFTIQICGLLQYLHSSGGGILYLDLQPDNILVSEGTIRLIDFGSAVHAEEAATIRYGFGTPGFAAPELRQKGSASVRSDIFAAGMILKYLYASSGRKAGRKIEKVIGRCTAGDPESRYCDMRELKRELLRAAGKTGSAEDNRNQKRHKRNSMKGGIIEISKGRIGVYGLSRGTGTTYTAILLAVYLRERFGGRVAVLEMSGREDFKFLESEYFGCGLPECVDASFTIRGITFWKSIGEGAAALLFNRDYDYLVLDLGSGERTGKELLRCGEKLVIGSGAPWKRQEWISWFENSGSVTMGERWHYLCTPGGKPAGSRRMPGRGQIAAMPVTQSCLELTEEAGDILDRLFREHSKS